MKSASVLTYGCAHNQKDSELIEAKLLENGYDLVETSLAKVVVVNTCTVKEPTESKIINKLQKLQKLKDKKLVIAGCLSQSAPKKMQRLFPEAIILGVNAVHFIIDKLNNGSSKKGRIEFPVRRVLANLKDKPLLKSNLWNKNRNIIQINEGCLNSCTFCATKLARGRLRSYRKDSIIRSLRNYPVQEIWLTSQDTGCWGFDHKENLAQLINEIDKIQRKFWVRVGMGNPNNFIKFLDEAVEAFRSDKIYKFLHLPVQTGSNQVLNHMKRGYTVEEYELIVEAFRKAIPELTLSTDVIVAYPTETEEDYLSTLKTIKKTKPNITNISKFWPREGTPAAKLELLPSNIRKERVKYLRELTEKIQIEENEKWINWEGEALVVDKGSKGGYEARNIYYKPIIVKEAEIGSWIKTKIVSAKSTYFFGEIIR